MIPYFEEHFGNPSSAHAMGTRARDAVSRARSQVARLVGCTAAEVVFTSGGSESVCHALTGAVRRAAVDGRTPHVVTSCIEHPCVTETLRALQATGECTSTAVAVDAAGLVSVKDVVAALRNDTALVTIMHSNNEVGSLQPIAEICRAVREHYRSGDDEDLEAKRRPLIHCDASQSVGKVALSFLDLGVDLLSLAGHKMYAPKGCGALLVRAGIHLPRLIHGAPHEAGRRAGTENVPYCVALGAAAELAMAALPSAAASARAMRILLRDALARELAAVSIAFVENGPTAEDARLPNTLSISMKGVHADALLASVASTVAASAGAACHSGGGVSHVLRAMRVDPLFAAGTVRFSVGRTTTESEILDAAVAIAAAVRALPPASH